MPNSPEKTQAMLDLMIIGASSRFGEVLADAATTATTLYRAGAKEPGGAEETAMALIARNIHTPSSSLEKIFAAGKKSIPIVESIAGNPRTPDAICAQILTGFYCPPGGRPGVEGNLATQTIHEKLRRAHPDATQALQKQQIDEAIQRYQKFGGNAVSGANSLTLVQFAQSRRLDARTYAKIYEAAPANPLVVDALTHNPKAPPYVLDSAAQGIYAATIAPDGREITTESIQMHVTKNIHTDEKTLHYLAASTYPRVAALAEMALLDFREREKLTQSAHSR